MMTRISLMVACLCISLFAESSLDKSKVEKIQKQLSSLQKEIVRQAEESESPTKKEKGKKIAGEIELLKKNPMKRNPAASWTEKIKEIVHQIQQGVWKDVDSALNDLQKLAEDPN